MNSQKNNTLLCIDDDIDVLNMLERLFKKEGFNVLLSKHSTDVAHLLEENDVGVVLCDYNIPGKDGIQLLSEVREKYPQVVRLLLTAETDSKLTIDAINKGAIFKFANKLWDSTELILMVREAFQLFNLSRENENLTKQLTEANETLSEINKNLEDRVEEKAEEIAKLTFYDEITDLPNKTFLMEWLGHAITQAKRNEQTIGVFMLGLDRFKKINDSLGHKTGDRLLKMMATQIANYTRNADAVCRISGDMFCVVLHRSGSTDDTSDIAERLLKEIESPLTLDDKDVYLTASLGISIYPNDGIDPDILLRNAESALNHAKEKGGNNFLYYTEEFNSRAKRRLSLEAELHKAIKNEEFLLYYQPRVNSHSLENVAAEALLRWQHPSRGLVSPGEFIPLLEETGLIRPVGEWVIQEVCEFLKRWQEQGLPKIRISANLSPVQFTHNNLLGQIRNIAADNVYAPLLQHLEMEITESVLVDDIEHAKSILQRLPR